ncbi:malto-oligosyltrehalose synthase [Streptomyces typhae]|uniref:malto-oligosyltrehalose synthase n=1 Tax=Streptomyces typhae TaxID=2681492 RepID=UPI001FEAEA55|nr:malto-oligosyltrehalose synthase [Streptomyces typhae]
MTPQRPEPVVPPPPTATYRLQLQPDFPFAAAARTVPYLAALGVSHLHLSPILEAVPGSTHGYDVVDHGSVRAELGGEEGLRALSDTARAAGLGLVVDIVPNHIAASPRHNRALWEVLREGPHSPYARWFDIDWEAGGGKVLLPVLGGPVGGELAHLRVEDGELRYFDHAFPLREGTGELPLDRLLDAQWYRPAWWRLARTEINYRRFFTISDLIAVRIEDPEVFDATHATVLRLLREGVVEGLRVDHPDGLADPGAYLRRLHEATGGRWTVVEKILADGERLPAAWQVAGTTGYDALRHVDGVLADDSGSGDLLGQYRRFAAPPADRGGDWGATLRRAAYKVVTHELAAEIDRLTREATALCAADPALRDHAPWALRAALRELLVRLEVYRPYAAGGADPGTVLTAEAAADAKAVFAVREEGGAVDAVRGLVLGGAGSAGGAGYEGGLGGADGVGGVGGTGGAGGLSGTGVLSGTRGLSGAGGVSGVGAVEAARSAFRARFAQTAAALRAKSLEDTAFYRHAPLLSAAEVGGSPDRPAVDVAEFHAYCARVQRDWPYSGTVMTTHDTKRSADVRAGVSVLSQAPARWAALLAEVTRRTEAGGRRAPDPQLAWAAWQTAVGFAPAALSAGATGATTAGTTTTGATTAGAASGTDADAEAGAASGTDADAEAGAASGTGATSETGATAATGPTTETGPTTDADAVSGTGATGSGSGSGSAGPYAQRLRGALLKHVREAGLHTNWTEPDEAYEQAVAAFLEAGPCGPPLHAVTDFAAELAPHVRANVLGGALLHLTMPGVPDLYQGTEREYHALVDPDNRHRVGFDPALLERLDGPREGWGLSDEKLAVTAAALRLRARRPELFGGAGTYEPLPAVGSKAGHCLAHRRSGAVVVAVTRLSLRLADAGGWGDTALPLGGDGWRDLLVPGREFSGDARVAELFAELPVVLLERV